MVRFKILSVFRGSVIGLLTGGLAGIPRHFGSSKNPLETTGKQNLKLLHGCRVHPGGPRPSHPGRFGTSIFGDRNFRSSRVRPGAGKQKNPAVNRGAWRKGEPGPSGVSPWRGSPDGTRRRAGSSHGDPGPPPDGTARRRWASSCGAGLRPSGRSG